jgi:hypothetical protein
MLTTSPFAIIIIVEVVSLCVCLWTQGESADLEVSDPIFGDTFPPTAKIRRQAAAGCRGPLLREMAVVDEHININNPRRQLERRR